MHRQINQLNKQPENSLKMDKNRCEIEDEIRLLKMIFEIHAGQQFIKGEREFEKHIDSILDRISELEKKLKKIN